MNVEWYIARGLLKGGKGSSTSIPIVRIAVAGIALGVCVMLLSIFVIAGFKKEIREKLSGFLSHLSVLPGEAREHLDDGETLAAWIEGLEGVKEAVGRVEKPAILASRRGERLVHGVMARGTDAGGDLSFFRQHLVAGDVPGFTTDSTDNGILLSANVARYLDVSVGDRLTAYFPDAPRRPRKFEVRGIYRTGFKEYDDVLVLVDQRHLLRLNGWKAGERSAIAVTLEEGADAARVADRIKAKGGYAVKSMEEIAPQVFDWLKLLDLNVWIILALLVSVAGFNMISGLLVLILDKTAMIGTLKALGCGDGSLQMIFLHVATGLVGRGMLWGNALALALAGVQRCFHVVTLDAESYYMSTVPVAINAWHVVLLNAGVMAVTIAILVVPTIIVSRVNPVRSMKFE